MHQVRWFYLRDESDFPVACIASRLNDPEAQTIDFALSIRNLKDEYDSGRGRDIAVGRLNKNRTKHIKTVPRFGAKIFILTNIMEDKNVPMRIRAAAGYRLALLKQHIQQRQQQDGEGVTDAR